MLRTIMTSLVVALCTAAAQGTESSVPFVHAPYVHDQGITGAGATVAVVDTGVNYAEEGLAESCHRWGATFRNGLLEPGQGADQYGLGHGTYMALIVTDASGVAPEATVLSVCVFGPAGTAKSADVILGIRYVTFLSNADPSIHVINLSLGSGDWYCDCDADGQANSLYANAISSALAKGIVTFAATGNEGHCGTINAPACVSPAVRVAATYDDYYDPTYFEFSPTDACGDLDPQPDWTTCFSNITDGCEHLLGAPGYDISVRGYSGDGTSQATAHCSGACALMFSKAGDSLPGITARNTIFNTAREVNWAWPYCPLPPEPRHLDALAAVSSVGGFVPGIPGDFDGDGALTAFDLDHFITCMTGPDAGPVAGVCKAGDFAQSPPDGDVDLADLGGFQRAFTGYLSGACCHLDGTCSFELAGDCIAEFGATYQGNGVTCAEVDCPLPGYGACCNAYDGTCSELDPVDCGWSDGLYLGDGTTCASTPCPESRYHNVTADLSVFASAGPGRMLADDIHLSGTTGGALRYYDALLYGNGGGTFDATITLYNGQPGAGGQPITGTQRTITALEDLGSPVFASADFDPPVTIPRNIWMVIEFSNSSAGWFRADEAEIGHTNNYYARYDPPVEPQTAVKSHRALRS